jgi:hypothetical protein
MTIYDRVRQKIKRSKRFVFARADFKKIAGYDQVGRALKQLLKNEELIRIGYGLYTKAIKNRITGQLMPASPGGADAVIVEAVEKLGVDYSFDEFSQQSLSGNSLQIPASFQIFTNKRFKRKIMVSNRVLNAN